MRVGKDTCQWLTLSSTDHCSTRCMDVYCGVHLNLLRKGGGTTPCTECGKGVRNSLSLCQDCGYGNEWHRRQYALNKEFKRLTATLQKFHVREIHILDISTGVDSDRDFQISC